MINEKRLSIQAGLVNDPPQAYACVFNSDRQSCPDIGSNVEIFETVAALMNWNINYVKYFSYGSAGPNKTLSGGGLAGGVQRSEFTITATLMSINPSFIPYLDYSYPITYLRFGLLAHPPQPRDISLLIVKPFHLSVWIVIAIFLTVFLFLIRLADKFRLFDFSRLLKNGSIIWLAFFICASYSSLIKACLLKVKHDLPFENLEQLLSHTLANNGSYILLSEFNYWNMSKDDWVSGGTMGRLGREANERGFTIYDKNVNRLLNLFATHRRYVLWGDESRIYRGRVEIPGSLPLFDDAFKQVWLAFGLPKKSNWTRKVDRVIPHLFDFAFRTMSRYAKRYAISIMGKISNVTKHEEISDEASVALSLRVLQGSFVILLLGIGMSTICFLIEHFFQWLMKMHDMIYALQI